MPVFDENNHLLKALLAKLPAGSVQHRLILTTWMLAMYSNKEQEERTVLEFVQKVGSKKWKIDLPALRFLIRKGNDYDRFSLMASSICGILPRSMFRNLWRRCFNEGQRNEYRMWVLSDLLMASLVGDEFRDAGKFRKELCMLVAYRSVRVQRRAITPAIFLDPPEGNHFRTLLKGLSHADDAMRMDCVNALQMLLEVRRKYRVSPKAIELISELNFRPVLQKMTKSKDLSGNARAVLSLMDKHGFK